MSIFADLIDKVTPAETPDDRAEARQAARDRADAGDWLSQILDHHVEIEAAFAAVKSAAPDDRFDALKQLGILLNGHSMAEEAVIYPALSEAGQKRAASHAYTEQATVKMEMAELEKLDPDSDAFTQKLAAIEEAVVHHVYEEESSWFPELKDTVDPLDQDMMSERYREECDRYLGADATLAVQA